MKILVILIMLTILNAHAGAPPGAGDSCANGVLICNGACLAPGSPGYDDKYVTVCHGTNYDGTTGLTSPQLPAACSVPPTGGTINCANGACLAAAANISKVEGKTSSGTPAIPYVKYVRGNADKLNCQLVYDASCSVKTVPNSMCKKAGAMIPPKAISQPTVGGNING